MADMPAWRAGALTSAETVFVFGSLTVLSGLGRSGQAAVPGSATAAQAGSWTSCRREP